MSNYKLKAAIFEHGLRLGVVRIREVVDWADSVIAENDEAHEWMIALALGGSKSVNQTLEALEQVPGRADKESLWRGLKVLLADSIKNATLKHERVVSYLYGLTLTDDVPKYDLEPIYRFEHDYDLLLHGYGSRKAVDKRLLEFLQNNCC
jgi:hypothetical protein